MKYERNQGSAIVSFDELRREGQPPTVRVNLAELGVNELKAEIYRRQYVAPFIKFADLIIARAKTNGVELSEDRLFYERNFDILGRPEVFIGYNVSKLSIEEILEEDDKIEKGLLPKRIEGQPRMVWTKRLVVGDAYEATEYGQYNDLETRLKSMDSFVAKVADPRFRT